MTMNWCKYFTDIYNNPKALTPRITVRQRLESKTHYQKCEGCKEKMNNLLPDPNETGIPAPSKN